MVMAIMEDLIVHLFLTKRTPSCLQENLDEVEHELILHTIKSIQKAMEKVPSSQPRLSFLLQVLQSWERVQPGTRKSMTSTKFVKKFMEEISSLKEGGLTVPIYVRKQNCTVLISKIKAEDEEIRIQTFRPSLPSKMVMSTVGSLEVEFPHTTELVKNGAMLRSQVFARKLYELTVDEFELSMETTTKGREEVVEKREVPEPFLVSDFLVGILAPKDLNETKGCRLTCRKKIRDQITMKPSAEAMPFRRSGLWTSVKVALQLRLMEDFGPNEMEAKEMYKLVLIWVLVGACQRYMAELENWRKIVKLKKVDPQTEPLLSDDGDGESESLLKAYYNVYQHERSKKLDLDVASQMLAKIGRRIAKLEKFNNGRGDLSNAQDLEVLRQATLENAFEVMEIVKEQMQTLWNGVIDSNLNSPANAILRTLQEFERDTVHQIPDLDNFLLTLGSETALHQEMDAMARVCQYLSHTGTERYNSLESIQSAPVRIDPTSNDLIVWLHDTETFLKWNIFKETDPEKLHKIMESYLPIAKEKYKENPVGFSQMILVALNVTKVMDEIAVEKYPLMKEYTLDVDTDQFGKLLLAHWTDVKLLDEIEDYVKARNRNASKQRPLLEQEVDQDTFSVKFASSNEIMCRLKREIEERTESDRQNKFSEVQRVRSECQGIQKQMSFLGSCSCRYEWKDEEYWDRRREETRTRSVKRKVHTCRWCDLSDELQMKRCSVGFYERPLPSNEWFQYAVVFELLIPKEIKILRDSLAVLKFELFGEENICLDRENEKKQWIQFLHPWTNETSEKISLGSSSLPFSLTSYSRSNYYLDVLGNVDESFVKENGMACKFFYGNDRAPVDNFNEKCTFLLRNTFESKPYLSLQDYLESCGEHHQNEVIANQVQCHPELSRNEFITFGSIRAEGVGLQLRNLFRAISGKKLSIEKEPVLALVLQAMWQVGRRDGTGQREAHLDFLLEPGFARCFLEELDRLLEVNRRRYDTPVILLVAVLITGRVMELSPSLFQHCYDLFKKWRKLGEEWFNKVAEKLAGVRNQEHNWVEILLEIRICILMTYRMIYKTVRGRGETFSSVFRCPGDIVHYFRVISDLHEHRQEFNSNISSFMKILEEMAEGVKLLFGEVEEFRKSPFFEEGLKQFIREKVFGDPEENVLASWEISPLGPLGILRQTQIVVVKYIVPTDARLITLNLITGELLLNGLPRKELSTQFLGDEDFRRVFRSNPKFHLKRTSSSVLRTMDPFQGKHYEFKMMENSRLRVVQENQAILVPHNILKGHLNDYFIDNFTHWLDITGEGIVNFYQIIGSHSTQEYTLRKCESGWVLRDEQSQTLILSMSSEGHRIVTQALAGLELHQYIHVTFDKAEEKVKARLRRHNLDFNLNLNRAEPHTQLESHEYPGFYLSPQQHSYGTLVGLRDGLLMEHRNGKRFLMVPHGTLQFKEERSSHQVCTVSMETLAHPPNFIYDFDDVLKRLKARKSTAAWLYLAALHAATSSPTLVDPYTGVTGTERAVDLLQEGVTWSCSPYGKEAIDILKFIRSLAPKRNYYGRKPNDLKREGQEDEGSFEIVEWPEEIPSMVAYDGYVYLVNKLVQDSLKLETLFVSSSSPRKKQKNKEEKKQGESETLRIRAYLRSLSMYNDCVALEEHFIVPFIPKRFHFPGSLILRNDPKGVDLKSSLEIAHARYLLLQEHVTALSFQRDSLTRFLFVKEPLHVPTPEAAQMPQARLRKSMSLKSTLNFNFRTDWLTLYEIAKTPREEGTSKLDYDFLLGTLAYKGAPMVQISTLHLISICSDNPQFHGVATFPEIPNIGNVEDPTAVNYVAKDVAEILEKHAHPFSRTLESYNYDLEQFNEGKGIHEGTVRKNCRNLAELLRQYQYCSGIVSNNGIRNLLGQNGIKVEAIEQVNSLLKKWYETRQLKVFIDDLQGCLNKIVDFIKNQGLANGLGTQIPTLLKRVVQPLQKCEGTEKLQLEKFFDFNGENGLALEANRLYSTGDISNIIVDQEVRDEAWLQCSKNECKLKADQILDKLRRNLESTEARKIYAVSNLSPRLSPVSLLKWLAVLGREDGERIQTLKSYCGALALLWFNVKRFNRFLQFRGQELERELANVGHQNWSPSEHPEWLLLELELDITIRPIQVDVARQMMQMPDEGNGVMQLNMGEGKTSVIVPMLCLVLASKDSLCRVTVLESLFKMNWDILKFTIGGILRRRVYAVPCRRDMPIKEEILDRIQESYEDCLKMRGVVLTLREYRVSFELLGYDKLMRGNMEIGCKLRKIEDWLKIYARDILDESDKLLDPKFQLVYTVGDQVTVDGEDMRWKLCQTVLEVVQEAGLGLLDEFGPQTIEFGERMSPHKHKFSHMRFLVKNENQEFSEKFKGLVADRFLSEINVQTAEGMKMKRFMIEEEIELEVHQEVKRLLKERLPERDGTKVLILSGYLRNGVLALALGKRWRVEYGVDPEGKRRMAVPFRAKDVAAERTEYGHADLAIILTHLSYYYSGLKASEMKEIFETLEGMHAPEVVYGEWINQIPRLEVPGTLREYGSLNLKDTSQMTEVFHLLREHKMVIDFWLSNSVLPKEAKQFPGKLVGTAWNLVKEGKRHVTTGFSGTNDSAQALLPVTISQQDLAELQETNVRMERILLGPENNIGHRGLRMGVTCREILEQLRKDGLKILIDGGALMLDCDNEGVAELWLEVDPGIEAAVYVNKRNELMVKARSQSQDTPLELSPFQGRLEVCGVFLDDNHIRGTDMKFPEGSKACVTVGTRMKREDLLQASMRMRKLGNGHSVAFYLSHEAYGKVQSGREQADDFQITTEAVLDWVKKNTREYNADGILYVARGGLNYVKGLVVDTLLSKCSEVRPMPMDELKYLAELVVDKEVTRLEEMYGQHTTKELLEELIGKWFVEVLEKLRRKLKNRHGPVSTWAERLSEIMTDLQRRCRLHAPGRTHFSSATSGMMEEEQEKELEVEIGEERQVERPAKRMPAKPSLHKNVKACITGKRDLGSCEGIIRLSDIFKETTFAALVQFECWSGEVYATKDFATVLDPNENGVEYHRTDDYLRPVEYVASFRGEKGSLLKLLLLSPHEIDKMLPFFRSGEVKCQLRMFNPRRFGNQDVLLNNLDLQLPSSRRNEGVMIPLDNWEATALFIASGNLFFGNEEEQRAFANFLSLVPKPWTEEKEEAFENGKITPTCFLLPEYTLNGTRAPKRFLSDPTGMVLKILECRHPSGVSEIVHVMRLLESKVSVEIE